jgi:hypothetical protein
MLGKWLTDCFHFFADLMHFFVFLCIVTQSPRWALHNELLLSNREIQKPITTNSSSWLNFSLLGGWLVSPCPPEIPAENGRDHLISGFNRFHQCNFFSFSPFANFFSMEPRHLCRGDSDAESVRRLLSTSCPLAFSLRQTSSPVSALWTVLAELNGAASIAIVPYHHSRLSFQGLL